MVKGIEVKKTSQKAKWKARRKAKKRARQKLSKKNKAKNQAKALEKLLRRENEAPLAIERADKMNREAGSKKHDNVSSLCKPKIWQAGDNSYKRCENCLNFIERDICRKHNRAVSKDNACENFYAPKVYLGGTFSPR